MFLKLDLGREIPELFYRECEIKLIQKELVSNCISYIITIRAKADSDRLQWISTNGHQLVNAVIFKQTQCLSFAIGDNKTLSEQSLILPACQT